MSKSKIKKLAKQILKESTKTMLTKIEKAINCGALDIDSWDENSNPMIIPKVIVMAILEEEAEQYSSKGTSFEREIKIEVKNLKIFL